MTTREDDIVGRVRVPAIANRRTMSFVQAMGIGPFLDAKRLFGMDHMDTALHERLRSLVRREYGLMMQHPRTEQIVGSLGDVRDLHDTLAEAELTFETLASVSVATDASVESSSWVWYCVLEAWCGWGRELRPEAGPAAECAALYDASYAPRTKAAEDWLSRFRKEWDPHALDEQFAFNVSVKDDWDRWFYKDTVVDENEDVHTVLATAHTNRVVFGFLAHMSDRFDPGELAEIEFAIAAWQGEHADRLPSWPTVSVERMLADRNDLYVRGGPPSLSTFISS